ncbi:L,D-transpeptidase [Aestuariivirga sp.]|uniref:L,D-transpeptidase n=1 Tax=Aestuariivirga sp. TaxID=2650926 RepID=UPI0035941559
MLYSRREFLGSMLAAGCLAVRGGDAEAAELVPIFASEALEVPYKFRRQEVKYKTSEPAGTIVVDPKKHWLYHVQGGGKAIRYGVGVGADGKTWSGEAVIKRKQEWPKWKPTKEHLAAYPSLAKYKDEPMPGGRGNPMGARALYLFQGDNDTLYRIHGTPKPSGIGRNVTSGCIRMLNVDVIHLYNQVEIGTRVVVLPG